MSKIKELGDQLQNSIRIAAEYLADLDKAEEHIALKGKQLQEALKEQAAHLVYYDQRRIELRTIKKYVELRMAKTRGLLTRQFRENYSRDLGERMIEKYVDKEEEYIKIAELLLEVEEVLEKYESMCNSLTTRGFALRDFTQARIHQIENSLL